MTKCEPFAVVEPGPMGWVVVVDSIPTGSFESEMSAKTISGAINAAHDKAVREAVGEFREREKVLLSALESIRNQCDEFRENVLNCRHQLQDWTDADMVNDVLELFDDVVTGFAEKALPIEEDGK